MRTLAPGQCDRCGEHVTWGVQYNGARRPFNTAAITPPRGDSTSDLSARWYAVRGKGMVPGDMLNTEGLSERPYLTRHLCIPKIGTDSSILEIRNLPGQVKVEHLQLDSLHEYTYRWPSHWAHVLRHDQYRAICGSSMPQGRRTNPRERARLRDMPVCPECIERLNLPADSRARALLHQVRERARAQVEDAVETIEPASTGFRYFRARFKGLQAPVHTAECPTLVTAPFVPFEWSMTETYPLGSSPCTICQPVTGLDDLYERRMARRQAEMAADVARAQQQKRYEQARDAFGELGKFVYRPRGGGRPATKVHHHACRALARLDPADGWVGVSVLPESIEPHHCTTYTDIPGEPG